MAVHVHAQVPQPLIRSVVELADDADEALLALRWRVHVDLRLGLLDLRGVEVRGVGGRAHEQQDSKCQLRLHGPPPGENA